MVDDLKGNACAYADFLENNGCEFLIMVRDPDTGIATALMSEQCIGMLAGVFDKSKEVYDAFKMAESWMLLGGGSGGVCPN